MNSKSHRIFRLFSAALVACLLSACGGGGAGDDGEASFAGGTPPLDIPSAPPPGAGDPGGDPGFEPPADPPPSDPPADPPPVDPPSDPGIPVEPPMAPILPTYGGYADCAAVAVDQGTETVYAISSTSGALIVLVAGAEDAATGPATGLSDVRGLCFDDQAQVLLAVTDGAPGSDDVLHSVDPATGSVQVVGTITGHSGVESLVVHQPTNTLFAVDALSNQLLSLDRATGLPTAIGSLGASVANVRGLCSDAGAAVLFAIDGASGMVVAIDPATGAAQRRVILAEGGMDGFSYSQVTQKFYGVSQSTGELHVLDPRGTWIEWQQIRGLAHAPSSPVLYGTHTGFGLVVSVEIESDWKQVVTRIADIGLESLAADTNGQDLYAVSKTTRTLYRVSIADATHVTVGPISGVATPLDGLAGLAFAAGQLYAIDTPTGTVLRVDPTDASALVLTMIPDQMGIQGLGFDPERGLLLGYADGSQHLVGFEPTLGASATELDDAPFGSIGGTTWIADEQKLVGSELPANSMVTLEAIEAPALAYGDIHALALDWSTGELSGFDVGSAAYLRVVPMPLGATPLGGLSGGAVEAMAFDPGTGTVYAADAATQSLYTVQGGGFTRVGAAGALGTAGLRAMAFDPSSPPGVLYGFDGATQKLVSIDTTTAAVTPIGAAIGFTTVDAMTFDPDTNALVAIDRSTQTLMELDRTTGQPTAIGPIEFTDVRGMVIMPGSFDVLLIDTELDQVVYVNRFTGETSDPVAEQEVTRSAYRPPLVSLLWPAGPMRKGHIPGFAIEVADTFNHEAAIVFRRGKEVLHRATFAPDTITTIAALPASLASKLKLGDEITWGIEFADKTPSAMTSFTVVDGGTGTRALEALARRPYLAKQSATVREALAADVLARHGFHAEALARGLALSGTKGLLASKKRIVESAARMLFRRETPVLDTTGLATWLAMPQPESKSALALLRGSTLLSWRKLAKIAPAKKR